MFCCGKHCLVLRIWGGYEECYLLGYSAVQSVEIQPTFRKNISPPSSGSKNKPSKKEAWELCLPFSFTLVSCSAYFSSLKMEATRSSETLVDFQRTTWRYVPDYSTLHCFVCCFRNKRLKKSKETLLSSFWFFSTRKKLKRFSPCSSWYIWIQETYSSYSLLLKI
jgi:hypothetical protein